MKKQFDKLKPVNAWKTSDGNIFEVESQAIAHQTLSDMREEYSNNKILGTYAGSYAEFDDVVAWIIDNADDVEIILKNKNFIKEKLR